MRARTILPILFLLLAAAGPAFAIKTPYTVEGDYVIFNIDTKIVSSTGKARVQYPPITISADSIQVDVIEHVLKARGDVQIVTSVVPPAADGGENEAVRTETPFDEAGNENVSYLIVREETGNQKIYVGDTLVYDLNFMQGALVQTKSRVRKIYLLGETLEETAALQKLNEYIALNATPDPGEASVVANRFRVSPNAKYEAWHAAMWVKGNRIITLPYFTNTGRGVMPGRLRLRKASYSTNTNLNVTSEFRYKDAPQRRGVLGIAYVDRAQRHITLSLNQQFSFSKKVSSGLSISNFLAGGQDYSLSLNRRRSRFTQNLSMNFRPGETQTYNYSTTIPWNESPIQTSFALNRSLASDSSNMFLNMFSGGRSKYFGKRRDLGYRMAGSMQYQKYDYGFGGGDSVANSFVGVSFFRSAIRAGNGGLVSATVNMGHNANTSGGSKGKLGGTVNYNRQFGGGNIFNTSYSYNKSGFGGDAPAAQSMAMSLNFNKLSVWNTRLASTYNINYHKFSDLSLYFDYRLNKNLNLSSSLQYGLESHRFSAGHYIARYNLMGTLVNTSWNKENNDFVVDFSSRF